MSSAPLRLHGYPVSNYFNIARAALIEKGLDFEVVIARAAQDEAFLAMNPMGKIPVLETPDGWIAETVAILEYLDDRYPAPSLRPADVMARARGRQIVNVLQMYVETPVRSLFPGVFAGGSNAASTVAAVRATLDRAAPALARLIGRPAPFLLGAEISQADLFAFYNLEIAERVTGFVYARSIFNDIGGLEAWREAIAARSGSRTVLADFDPYFQRYLADHGAPYRPPSAAAAGQRAQGHLAHA